MLFDSISSWTEYLKAAKVDDPGIPASLADMQSQCGCKLVLSDASDPEGVGFVQWRLDSF